MKTITALSLFALGLAGCETYPGQYGYPQGPAGYPPMPAPGPYPQPYPPQAYPPQNYPGPVQYRAMGTEPGWSLTLDGREMRFDGDYGQRVIVQPQPVAINGTAGEIYRSQRLEVNITHVRCNDGMSDRTYPDSVQVYADGKLYRGCGGAGDITSQPEGGYGQPQGGYGQPMGPAPMLAGTNWRIVAVNGQRVPERNFYLNFFPDGKMTAKLGCNTLNSSFRMEGPMLSPGAILATRMACPDMSFETSGSNVLSSPMTIQMAGPRLTLSNSAGTIEAVSAR